MTISAGPSTHHVLWTSVLHLQLHKFNYSRCKQCVLNLALQCWTPTRYSKQSLVSWAFWHLLLYHKCHAYVLSYPASQGHPVHWIALGPVLAIILVSSILLVLIAILLGALYKRRKTRCSGKQHTMLQIMTAFVDAILLHHFDNCDFTTSSFDVTTQVHPYTITVVFSTEQSMRWPHHTMKMCCGMTTMWQIIQTWQHLRYAWKNHCNTTQCV